MDENRLTNNPQKRFPRLPWISSRGRTSDVEQQQQQDTRHENLRSVLFAMGKRLATGAVTLTVIIFLTFFGLAMARGLAFKPALLRGFEKTLTYAGQLIRGDLGMTAEYGYSRLPVPITEVLPSVLGRTMGLLLASLFVSSFFGVLLGIWSAKRRNTLWPILTLSGSIVGISMPSFFAGLLLQLGVIKLTQALGFTVLPVGGFGWDAHLLLPAIVLATRPFAQITRVTHVIFSGVLEQDFVRTAHSKGLPHRWVINRHVLRNTAVPILTTIGLSLRFSLSSLPVVEFFFGWLGMGYHLLKAISNQDDQLAVAMFLYLGAFFILVNMLLELSYRFIDPRLRDLTMEAARADRVSALEWLQSLPSALLELVRDNPIQRWLRQRKTPAEPSPFRVVLEERGDLTEYDDSYDVSGTRRAWFKGTIGNASFVAGGIIVAVLLFAILFGSSIAPHSPYTTLGLEIHEGELSVPPYRPSETYPWGTDVLGRDIMSLVLAGAQQTFILATLVVLSRLALGFILGAIAGWWHGSWIDRFLLGVVEVIATFPMLLLAMNLILALNIREGMKPFVITLCVIGWGEIMQFVRGEVMRIRPTLFIENAVSTGVRTPRILMRHILPNIIPSLISLTSLEMGAILMLLGELGFIGIFIGGGIFAELSWKAPLYHYSDVPEWGALLSNVRVYAKSYPWTGLYPSSAFFIAILGLNLFGEGLRRMIELVGDRIMRLFNKYTLAATIAVAGGLILLRGSTGDIAIYQRQSEAFNGQRALQDVQALTLPQLEGRSVGTIGADITAEWIAQQFHSLGIQPAGENLTYFQNKSRYFQILDDTPAFVIDDNGPALEYHKDFSEFPGAMMSSGMIIGPVRFVSVGEVTVGERFGYSQIPLLNRMSYPGEILLVLEKDTAIIENVHARAGALFITEDAANLQRRYTLSDSGWLRSRPALWISVDTADRLLEGTGKTVASLSASSDELMRDEVFELPLEKTVGIYAPGSSCEKIPVKHVIGHMPSYTSSQYGGYDDQLIVVLAKYDCPPMGPDGEIHLCANDNASGVAVMLEAIRTMRETGYQPLKTFLFIAYSGEGFEGGRPITAQDVDQFLEAKYGFAGSFELEGVIELRGLGQSHDDELSISVDGSLRLADLFETSARRVGLSTQRYGMQVDLYRIFSQGTTTESGEQAPRVTMSWEGWYETSYSAQDTLEHISSEDLAKAGRALTLTLMIVGRSNQY